MKSLIVFDVDGTILDSFGVFEKVILDYSKEQGLPVPCLESIRHGYNDPDSFDFKWGVSKEDQKRHLIETFIRMDKVSLSGEAHYTPDLFDGVAGVLADLKDLGHTLAIVTSKPEAPLVHLLETHKVLGLFSAHRTWDDIKRRNEKEKPAPDMLLSVMRDLNFLPDQTIMIGDTTMDVVMGRASNSSTIGVTWGAHPKHLLQQAGAHHIVETHFDDVRDTIHKNYS